MRISTNWLADYVSVDWTPDELADRLTMSGLEVESVDRIGSDLAGVVVGHVLAVSPHPDADRLTVCRVDLGSGDAVQIVCGAPNVAEGQRVPVATVGTTLELPDRDDPEKRVPVTLKKAKIRGQESRGMICAEDELGLGSDHSGILVLDDSALIGAPFAEYLASRGVSPVDHSIDVSITPNRPDAISHIGVARDVSALSGAPLRRPEVQVPEAGSEAADHVSIEIRDPEGCTRYVGLLVRGVTVSDSPAWMQRRLEAAGMRAVNNIVDITNYVMLECGQPLHAFDFDHVSGGRIVVHRTGKDGTFTTLDDKERALPAGTLMIADGERDVAVAGVMGGQNSEVSDATTNVLIESAWFNPADIRRAAKALGLQTDASYRFERGVDPTGQAWAAARAAQLMAELAGGTLVPGIVDAHPSPWQPQVLPLRLERISRLLGVSIPGDEVVRLLTAIGFSVSATGAEGWTVEVPPFRPDVEREVDLIEEVARLYGLDRIPEPESSRVPNSRRPAPPALGLRLKVADRLVGLGFREIYTNSMMRLDRAEQFASAALRGGEKVGEPVSTLNPISREMAVLRPSLLAGALQVLAHNLNHGQPGLRAFEFGHVFDRNEEAGAPVPGYREREHLLLLAAGREGHDVWSGPAPTADFYVLKGLVTDLASSLGLPALTLTPRPSGSDLTRYHLDVELQGRPIGTVGCLDGEVAEALDISVRTFFAELNFSALVAAAPAARKQYESISRYPVVDRDIAVVVDRDRPAGEMLAVLERSAGNLLREARIFDIYEGKGIPDGRKSVAFAMQYGADRTLKDKEVDKAVSRVVQALAQDFGAELRS